MIIHRPKLKFKEEPTLRPWTRYIVIHHVEPLIDNTHNTHHTIQEVHQWHLKRPKWIGFGYHYYIDKKDCQIYEGRQRNTEGSHVKSYNDCTLGVCFDGHFGEKNKYEGDKISDKQLNASVELLATLQVVYDAPLRGHCDFPSTDKSCPGRKFPMDILKCLVDEKKFTLLQNEVMGLPIIPTNLTFKGPLDSREKTDYIVIHHTAVLRPHTVQEVHQWHLNRKDEMYGIAYHYFIKKDGTVYEGRPRDSKGALVRCVNSRAIGICLEGNFNKETIGEKQWEACVKLAALLEMQYRAKTHQHREVDNKTSSPGLRFDFEKFKSEVRKLKAQTKSILSKRLDDGGEIRQLPPVAFVPAEKYDAAADHPSKYLHLLEGKRVAVVCNPTSRVKNVHLVDFLLSKGIEVCKIFAPEHGFRGDADAGARINDDKDSYTQLPIISIYNGNTLLPSSEDLSDVDVILFDVQDVGVRFFTYLSNLTDMMEAAAVNHKQIIVFDRPNPNGFYVDGPIMPTATKGRKNPVGRHPVPIVYGMTIGEYAMMVNGEGWLKNGMKCDLTVVWMDKYNRRAIYELPVKPSPNLPNWQSVYLYPSLCLFEGTTVSVGRGTDRPFCCFGYPQMRGSFSFTPKSMTGATNPLHKNTRCNGESLVSFANDYAIVEERLHIEWLRDAYFQLSNLPDDDACNQSFFKPYFTTLMGDTNLKDSIIADQSIEDIHFSWQAEIHKFMKDIRSKYLHYL